MANGSDGTKRGIGRRSLLKGVGAAAAAGAVLSPVVALAQDKRGDDDDGGERSAGPGAIPMTLVVNGEKRDIDVEPRRTLLDALRGDLDLTGAKRVCDRGTCGACTIWLDDKPVYACMVLAIEAVGARITTVEGLGTPDALHPVQAAFRKHDALQCGFCTPGFVMSCAWAVKEHGKDLDRETVLASTCGNLCRCGTYPHVVDATLDAAGAPAARKEGR